MRDAFFSYIYCTSDLLAKVILIHTTSRACSTCVLHCVLSHMQILHMQQHELSYPSNCCTIVLHNVVYCKILWSFLFRSIAVKTS